MKTKMITVVSAALVLAGGLSLELPAAVPAAPRVGFDTALWAESEWISAVDAPVRTNGATRSQTGPKARAADGTSWFATSVVNARRVVKAEWLTSALGTYDLYVNGRRVGTDFLKPGFTHVKKTRRSFSYDVTALIDTSAKAENFLAAEVSAGWWRDKIVNFTGKKSAFRGVFVLTHEDGSRSVCGTRAKTWKAGTAGPVTHAAIFDGEECDARIAPPFRGEGLGAAEVNAEFAGEVLPSAGAEVCLRHDLAIVRGPYALKAGEKLVVDFGQNCAAVPSFRFKAAKGTVLTFLPAEMLNDADAPARGCDGPKGTIYRANLRDPGCAFRAVYTFGASDGFVEYHPRFTFFGYRYCEISATGDVEIERVASVPVTSITKAMEIGSLETGDAAVNRLIANVYWGQLSNYLSVPTDCPQRNERLGWTADTQVFTDAGAFNADTRHFFHKWMRDMRDTTNENGSFPGVAPFGQYGSDPWCHMRTGWADAGIIVPWKIWRQFGDRQIVDENWAAMEKFARHTHATKRAHEAVKLECGHYQWNDWLSLDKFESASSGLNPELDAFVTKDGKRVPRPGVTDYWSFLGACYWAIDMEMMKEMAAATGRDAAAWAACEAEAKDYLRKNYFATPDGTVRAPFADMQTPAVMALKLGLVTGAAKEKTVAFLKADLKRRGNVTGFLGCSWLMDVLSANGLETLSVDLLLNHKFPSWLYSVDQGATTIWERWNGWTKETGFGPVGMNSYNHYAYGQVLGWMYRRLAGIEPASDAPGFKRIVMRPIFDRRLGHVTASYRSAAGLIKSAWRCEGDRVVWAFTVPDGAVADVTLPGSAAVKRYAAGDWTVETALPASAPAQNRPSVRIAGEIGRKFETCLKGNVLKLDLEKDFFTPFVKREAESGFIGLGKHADAAVHFAANTDDPAAIAHKEKVIGFIIAHQLPDGYTGFFREDARLNKLWDVHEMGFIVQGLMSDWELFGNRAALEAAKRNADYVIDRYAQMKANWEFDYITDRETMLGFGFGVARLYAATKDEKYRSFLRDERSLDTWNQPIFIGREKMIYGQAYGYMGTCLEQLELYSWDPRPDYLRASRRALDFQTKGDGVLINGNGGICECWTNDQDGEGQVGETCNATFELLFWDALYRLNVADRALLGDLMERCIYNGFFAAMSEDGRRLRYYTPLNGDRKFWPDDLYCCPNNFRRGMSRLPEYVFYAEPKAVFANLYTACDAAMRVNGEDVKIAERTAYPKDGCVSFEIGLARPTFFSFNVRIPSWVRNPSVTVNGTTVTYLYKPGEILRLPRVWKGGDRVELNFPMSVRTVRGRKRQSGRFAVMRGPVVYALDTHAIDVFKDWHPHDVQTEMMMDPKRLKFEDGAITTYVSTENWAVGVADVSVDGKIPKNIRKVTLIPYCSEKANLTYFRAPDLEGDCRNEDELFVRLTAPAQN